MAKEKPSGAEWEKWKAKEEAHWAKHNKGSGTYFTFNGERWKLDNKATKGKPRKFSPKSVDQKNTENKKVGGHREKMLEQQTAKDVDPKEAQAARARINAKGNEHHHKNSRTRVEKGIQAKYGGEIPDRVRKQFADVGEFFGDDPRNFADLTIPEHRTGPNAVHKVEKYMDDSIKGATGSYQGLNLSKGQVRFSNVAKPINMFARVTTDYVEAIDELAGGAITNNINRFVTNPLRAAVGQGSAPAYKKPDPFAETKTLKRAKQSVQQGPKMELNLGGFKFKPPELGLSELLGFN